MKISRKISCFTIYVELIKISRCGQLTRVKIWFEQKMSQVHWNIQALRYSKIQLIIFLQSAYFPMKNEHHAFIDITPFCFYHVCVRYSDFIDNMLSELFSKQMVPLLLLRLLLFSFMRLLMPNAFHRTRHS